MSMSEKAFYSFAKELAKLNNLDPAIAQKYASLIGDTPLVNEKGLVEVRDISGTLLTELKLPPDD